jgi:signal transduction histidine kinase
LRTIRDYIPLGNTLEPDAFRQRHLLLCWILGLHVPGLLLFGLWRGVGLETASYTIIAPLVLLVCARLTANRRAAAFFVTAGLVFCSSALVHVSDGSIEAHFHFFILIGLIALYQDWVPFLWNAVFTVLSHGIGGALNPDAMYNHHAAQHAPWTWALVHGIAVVAACVGVIIFWKNTEIEQRKSMMLAARLAAAETEAAQRQTVSDLFVNLARRNQSLLDRQLELIAELEQSERTPEALDELFQLDHLATRIRRNAESLLVLSGDDPARRWGRPVPLGEVVRAAAAEVEDYRRVDILVSEHLEIAGHAVADLAHLLAELIENATRYSPATTEVRVRSYLTPGPQPATLLSIEDSGVGMSESDRQSANLLLDEPPDIDLRGRTMGFHVVSRLARRYDLDVSLAHTPGGGTTALVALPDTLVGEHTPEPHAPLHSSSAHHHPAAASAAPPAAPAPAPAPTPAPALQLVPPAGGELTSEGLVRRVPGAGLSPSLRRAEAPASAPTPARATRKPRSAPTDREQMRSLLSRFQASQRAGRAVADAPAGSLAHTQQSAQPLEEEDL